VRYFFSSGEPSGESVALLLAGAIRELDPQAQFEGIGGERMRASGFSMWRDHRGWASMGPIAAIPRIPKLLAIMWMTAFPIRRTVPDVVVLVDFGVFNLRLAQTLRRLRYDRPVLDVFPPGTWLDNESKARIVSDVSMPLTAFEHQRDFYRGLGLRIAYFGHPLTGQYVTRPPRARPPAGGGLVALLPGSREGEVGRHLPLLLSALRHLRRTRPQARGVVGAANEVSRARLERAVANDGIDGIEVVTGAQSALREADAAWIASGTAVLEAALNGVPSVALYVVAPVLVKHARGMIKHRFITLPNLVLGRAIVPELLQEEASPERLSGEMDAILRDPSKQYDDLAGLRAALGPPDALQQCAEFAVSLAREHGTVISA
jgi:lipid-A-disaccharide synthase